MFPTRASGKGQHSGCGGSNEGQLVVRVWRRLQQRLNLLLSGPSAPRRRRVVLAAVGLGLLAALMLLHAGSGSGSNTHSTSSVTTEQLRLSRASLAVEEDATVTAETTGASVPTASKRRPGDINLTPPLSRETLGHASWSLLHTVAALFPEVAPSLAKQAHVRALLEAIGELYPCATCARHFRAYMRDHPLPAVLQRSSLSEWLCHAHNSVNVRLNKPVFECAAETLALKWPPKLDEDCGCEQEEKEKEEAEKDADAQGEAQAEADDQVEPEAATDSQATEPVALQKRASSLARARPNAAAASVPTPTEPLSSDVVAAIAAAASVPSSSDAIAPVPPGAAAAAAVGSGERNPRLAALVAAALERDRLSAAKAALLEEEEAEARAEQLRDQRQKEREQQQQREALPPAQRIPLRRGEEPAISAMT